MNEKEIKQFAKKHGISIAKARKSFKLAGKAIKVVGEGMEPYDRTIENLTEQEILHLRTKCAESGTELTPQEIKDAVFIIKYIRSMLREEE